MMDAFGRAIDYMRISITDRCNLRCRYCMPHGVQLAEHGDLLTYEEILQVCRAAVSLGIVNFKITGGEPLVRRDSVNFIARLKALPWARQVTLTTNGLLLPGALDALSAMGIDGINISLDTLDPAAYSALTGCPGDALPVIRQALADGAARGLRMKVNAVLLRQTLQEIPSLALLARELPVDVRFIELMPIGEGASMEGASPDEALALLRTHWPDLSPTQEIRGNGPARYYAAQGLMGRIGFIDAVSRRFCADCNRVRLTSTGSLKPCLCYEAGVELLPLLRGGATLGTLAQAMGDAISAKPQGHCFAQRQGITEHKTMNQIGG